MKSNYVSYEYMKSFSRIDQIIDECNSYEEVDYIPSRDKLTYNNGFYVYCTALFVDIRGSSKLPTIHRRPKLAKLYRSYVSEIVALMNGNPSCIEVNIVGDCVSGIFGTNIDCVFSTAAQISSLINVMNYKFKKNEIETIKVGIGISYGRALMVKAGYSGSGINEVVWMGEVVNEASNLCSYGNKEWDDKQIMVSNLVYDKLNEDHKKLLGKNYKRGCYHGNVICVEMNNWYKINCI